MYYWIGKYNNRNKKLKRQLNRIEWRWQEKTSELEYRTIEFIQSEQQRRKKNQLGKQWTEPPGPTRQYRRVIIYVNTIPEGKQKRGGWKLVWRRIGWKCPKFGKRHKPVIPRSWGNTEQDKHKEIHAKDTPQLKFLKNKYKKIRESN